MPYQCTLGHGQTLYLDNSGAATLITIASRGSGQQQQSSTQVQTGVWTEVPQVSQGDGGILVRCVTAQGVFTWQVQGQHIGIIDGSLWSAAQAFPLQPTEAILSPMPPMPPMPPMSPMPPMKMGDMEMSANPMTMRMGNMQLSMDKAAPGPRPSLARFCTQCGAPVAAGDRFCGSCGHQLTSQQAGE